MENDDVVAIVSRMHAMGKSADDAAKILIARAAIFWRQFEGDYRDDITAIVLWLPEVTATLSQAKGAQAESGASGPGGAAGTGTETWEEAAGCSFRYGSQTVSPMGHRLSVAFS